MADKGKNITEGKIIELLEQLPDEVLMQFYYMIKGAALAAHNR